MEITSELQKAERAQYRLSALASGRVTSLSVVEHRTERLPPVKEKRRMFSHQEIKLKMIFFEDEVYPASEGFYFVEVWQP